MKAKFIDGPLKDTTLDMPKLYRRIVQIEDGKEPIFYVHYDDMEELCYKFEPKL
jgi:hypothetical protein